MTISFEDFSKVELVIGTIVGAEEFPEARKPAYKLTVDIGNNILKRSSAQITHLYTREELVGKQVICVANFPPKQIGPFVSEVLVCGFVTPTGEVVLAVPDKQIDNGTRLS